LTRWEFVEGGVRFRVWARPIVDEGGRHAVPVTLLWSGAGGATGMVRCGGLIEAMECAAQVAARYGAQDRV
jgi:hypothetical protein